VRGLKREGGSKSGAEGKGNLTGDAADRQTSQGNRTTVSQRRSSLRNKGSLAIRPPSPSLSSPCCCRSLPCSTKADAETKQIRTAAQGKRQRAMEQRVDLRVRHIHAADTLIL
jgi:hypothetical protein